MFKELDAKAAMLMIIHILRVIPIYKVTPSESY